MDGVRKHPAARRNSWSVPPKRRCSGDESDMVRLRSLSPNMGLNGSSSTRLSPFRADEEPSMVERQPTYALAVKKQACTGRGPVYMACQWVIKPPCVRPEGVVVICTDWTPKWREQGWPQAALIATRGAHWKKASGAYLGASSQIVLGTKLHITAVQTPKDVKLVNSLEEENPREGKKCWIRWKREGYALETTATAELSSIKKVPRTLETIGIIAGKQNNCCEVHAIGACRSTMLRQFESNLDFQRLQIGQLVIVTLAYTFNADIVGEGYILPKAAEHRLRTEVLQKQDGYIIGIHGLAKFTTSPTDRLARLTSKVALGSLLTIDEIRRKATGQLYSGPLRRDGNQYTFTVGDSSWSKRRFVASYDHWKEEARVEVRADPHYPDIVNAVGTILHRKPILDRKGDPTWKFDVTFHSVGARAIAGEIMDLEGKECHIQVIPGIQTLKERADYFAAGEFEKACQALTHGGTILRRLLGVERGPVRRCLRHLHLADESGYIPSYWDNMTDEQMETINELLCDCFPILLMQGSAAGTGKTETVVDAMLEILRRDPEARIALMTPLNASTMRMVRGIPEKVVEILRKQDTERERRRLQGETDEAADSRYLHAGVLLLLGFNAQKKYEDLWRAYRPIMLASKVKDWMPEGPEDPELQMIGMLTNHEERQKLEEKMEKLQKKERDDRLNDEEALLAVVAAVEPRILICTTAMAEREPQLLEGRTHLVFDEATHEPLGRASRLIAAAPKVRVVVCTGDLRQRSVFNDDKPELVRDWSSQLGFQPLLWEVSLNRKIRKTYLSYNWRAHPDMVRLLSKAFYENGPDAKPMKSRLRSCDRDMLLRYSTRGRIRLAQKDSPVVILHTTSPHVKEKMSNSSQNLVQTRIATALAKHLYWALKEEDDQRSDRPLISVLCLYSGQRRAVEAALTHHRDHIHIASSDSFQGSDAAVAVGVVTYSRGDLVPDDPAQFILENERALVFTSRAREGMFIVGNVLELVQGTAWRIFLEELTKTTPILDANLYIPLLTANVDRGDQSPAGSYDSRGFLVHEGESIHARNLPDYLYAWKDITVPSSPRETSEDRLVAAAMESCEEMDEEQPMVEDEATPPEKGLEDETLYEEVVETCRESEQSMTGEARPSDGEETSPIESDHESNEPQRRGRGHGVVWVSGYCTSYGGEIEHPSDFEEDNFEPIAIDMSTPRNATLGVSEERRGESPIRRDEAEPMNTPAMTPLVQYCAIQLAREPTGEVQPLTTVRGGSKPEEQVATTEDGEIREETIEELREKSRREIEANLGAPLGWVEDRALHDEMEGATPFLSPR